MEAQDLPPELLDPRIIDRRLCELSLREYIAQGWQYVETRVFVPNWHIDAISDHLEAVTRGQLKGVLLITVPPRCMKSLTVNVFWPSWTWAQNPDPMSEGHGFPVQPGTWAGPGVKFLSLSHNAPVAIRDSVKTRRLLDSSWYQQFWGHRIQFQKDQNQKQRYENTKGGYRLCAAATSVLGEGGDIVIGDDLISREEAHSDTVRESVIETLDQTISTRVNDPDNSVFVIIMQRLHEDDPAGHILNHWVAERNVTHLMLPMEFERERCCYSPIRTRHATEQKLQPVRARYIRSSTRWLKEGEEPRQSEVDEYQTSPVRDVYRVDIRTEEGELLAPKRFNAAFVKKLSGILGSYASAGQLQQRPAPREGGMFKRAWFKPIKEAPAGTRWVRYWDLAGTQGGSGARSAGVKLGRTPEGRFVVGHCITASEEGHQVRVIIKNTAETDGISVEIGIPQDPGSAGKFVAQDYIQLLAGWTVRAHSETGDKVTRAEPFSAQCEGGNVDMVIGSWNEEFLDEVCMFPNAVRKDIVDACSGAFARLQTKKGASSTEVLL